MLDIETIRSEFPALGQNVNGKPLVYLDNAATTQMPVGVLEAVRNYKERFNGNPHRGSHYLSVKATMLLEEARTKVAKFINSPSTKEVVFTKNATEALNLVAYSYGLSSIQSGDEIVICISEHHSNLVPWQRVAGLKGATLRYLYLTEEYEIDLERAKQIINEKTAVVAIAVMSNALGTIYPIEKIVDYAHNQGAVVVIDGAQSVPHLKTDVKKLNADFFVFSGHKLFAPMGIGVLYGKESFLKDMPPFLMGGEMVEYVTEQETSFNELPHKFEAGTPNVEGAVGLGAAIDYLSEIGWEKITEHEKSLTKYALEKLSEVQYLKIIGSKNLEKRGPVISFTLEGCHPHDISTIVDMDGIALRAGHHCAQPLMNYLQLPSTSRVSFSLYNTKEEIDILVESLSKVRGWLGYES